MPTLPTEIIIPKFFRYAIGLMGLMLLALSGLLWEVRQRAADTPLLVFMHETPSGESMLYLADANGNFLRRLTPPMNYVSQPMWTPDGSWVTWIGDTPFSDIYRVRPTGGKLQRLTHTPNRESSLTWSPDGKTLLFATDGFTGLYVMELTLDGLEIQPFTDDGDFAWQVVLSPDGKWVAYDRKGEGNLGYTIHLLRRDGSLVYDVGGAFEIGNLSEPAWTADGRWLSFVTTTEREATLYRLDTHHLATPPTHLYSASGFIREVAWSPDGKNVAITELNPSGLPNLHLMRFVGDTLESIEFLDAYYGGASWTADGEWVAYIRSVTGGFDVYRARADGTDVRRVTHLRGSEYDPRWATPIEKDWVGGWLVIGAVVIIGLSIGVRKKP